MFLYVFVLFKRFGNMIGLIFNLIIVDINWFVNLVDLLC